MVSKDYGLEGIECRPPQDDIISSNLKSSRETIGEQDTLVRLMKSSFREPVNIESDEMVSMNEMAGIVLNFENKKLGNTSNKHSQGGTSVFAPSPLLKLQPSVNIRAPASMVPIQYVFVSNPIPPTSMKPSASAPFIKDGKKFVKVLDLARVLSSSSKAKMQIKGAKKPT
ncbi:UNVERIFIED_CONTAM: GDP-mannose 3,5-epimerase 2 [Sesamum calycinum]|uniref:GDP-mannose 3,5-epimerase 2 n=1 Tax=Sesamum calycinum TaxID=2727403 RepID=A0AAW2JMI1_9LAMI